MSEEQQNPESEFDKAFSEAIEDAPTTKQEEEVEAEPGEHAQADEQKHNTDTEGDSNEAGEEDVDWRVKAEEEAKAREAAEQKMRSWDGRLRKSSEELAKEREARERLEKRLALLEQQSKEGDRKKLQEWIDEFGDDDEFAHITEVVKQQLNEPDTADNAATGEGDEREAEAMPEVDEEARAHFAAIEEKHKDWQELVGGLDGWIEQLPGRKALEYARVMQSGTAQEVIAMLDDYKAGDDKQSTTTDDADAMAAVRHRSSGRRPKGRPDKDDFDSAWEEAVSQEK